MSLDIQLFHFLNWFAGQNSVFDSVVIFFSEYLQYFVAIAFFWLIFKSLYTRKQKLEIFLVTTASPVLATVVKYFIRFFYHRPRPFVAMEVHKLINNSWFYSDTEWSFPSGHSSVFFAIAMAIYLYNKKWGTWFFVAAILINISRIVGGVHYPLDILAGAGIGMVSGYLVYHFIKNG